MPRNPPSEKRKEQVVLFLEQKVGSCYHKYPNRTDWYRCGAVEIFITDSSQSPPWYDMKAEDVEELASQAAAVVVFILGDADSCLVVTAKDLREQLLNHSAPTEEGFYHFHVVKGRPSFKPAAVQEQMGSDTGHSRDI